MAKRSAGIIMYRTTPSLEVLLVHPGGPFWARKDEASWSIPKGLIEDGEDPQEAARREFGEETGATPNGPLEPLGEFRQAGGKVVVAFACPGAFDPEALVSNTIPLEWPPH